MLKFTKNFDLDAVEYWREGKECNYDASSNIIYVAVDTIGLNSKLGNLPRILFRNLGLKILKISWKDNSKTLEIENVEKIVPVQDYKRTPIAQGLDEIIIRSAIERAVANLFFTLSKDDIGDYFHSSGEIFHKVKTKELKISENDLEIARDVVKIVRDRQCFTVKDAALIKV